MGWTIERIIWQAFWQEVREWVRHHEHHHHHHHLRSITVTLTSP